MVAHIEQCDGEILLTFGGGIPLVRYNIHDRGFIMTLRELKEKLEDQGYDFSSLFREKGYPDTCFLNLPFLVVFGRSNAVIIDGANIYREDIEFALENEHRNQIAGYQLAIETDEQQNMRFCIYLELNQELHVSDDKKRQLARDYHDFFLEKLPQINMDFRDALKVNPSGLDPRIRIFNFRDGPFENEDQRIKRKYIT